MASGDTLLEFLPLHGEPTLANYATFDVRNQHPVLVFDGATDEEVCFTGVVPANYDAGGMTVQLFILFKTATSGTSRWQVAFERLIAQDFDSDNFASFQSAAGSVPGTSGVVVVVAVVFTDGAQIASLGAGDLFRLKVRRDADGTSGTDDVTTDAQLAGVHVIET